MSKARGHGRTTAGRSEYAERKTKTMARWNMTPTQYTKARRLAQQNGVSMDDVREAAFLSDGKLVVQILETQKFNIAAFRRGDVGPGQRTWADRYPHLPYAMYWYHGSRY